MNKVAFRFFPLEVFFEVLRKEEVNVCENLLGWAALRGVLTHRFGDHIPLEIEWRVDLCEGFYDKSTDDACAYASDVFRPILTVHWVELEEAIIRVFPCVLDAALHREISAVLSIYTRELESRIREYIEELVIRHRKMASFLYRWRA